MPLNPRYHRLRPGTPVKLRDLLYPGAKPILEARVEWSNRCYHGFVATDEINTYAVRVIFADKYTATWLIKPEQIFWRCEEAELCLE